jgi:hypothetical protein
MKAVIIATIIPRNPMPRCLNLSCSEVDVHDRWISWPPEFFPLAAGFELQLIPAD